VAYRSRVRALLGMPEQSRPAFATRSAPVGFTYANDGLPDEVGPTPGPALGEAIQPPGGSETREARTDFQDTIMDRSREDKPPSAKVPEIPNPPEAVVKGVSVEIPGSSQRMIAFPALNQVEAAEGCADHPDDAGPGAVHVQAARSQAPIVATPSESGLPAIRPATKASSGADLTLEPGKPALEDSPVLAQVPPSERPAGPVPVPAGPYVGDRDSHDAAAKIAQLRHAVQELQAKLASQTPKEDSQRPAPPTQAEPPPPPAQPVVIIQQSIRRARTPRAFWERRHLGRSRLRTLR
jgi:hypothetical protein